MSHGFIVHAVGIIKGDPKGRDKKLEAALAIRIVFRRPRNFYGDPTVEKSARERADVSVLSERVGHGSALSGCMLNPKPESLNPQAETLNPKALAFSFWVGRHGQLIGGVGMCSISGARV